MLCGWFGGLRFGRDRRCAPLYRSWRGRADSPAACAWLPRDRIVGVEKFLKQRAVNIAVDGSYTLSRWYGPDGRLRSFACRTRRVSPFRMIVDVPVVGRKGDSLSVSFSEFGEFEGNITDTMQGSFLLELEMTRKQRAQLANKLTWLEKKLKDPTVRDGRQDARFIPEASHSTLTLADGSVHSCFIIDMSLSGAAVSAELQPPIGMPLAIGACVGRVVRNFETGFAVKFVERRNLDDLTRLIVRMVEKQNGSAKSEPVSSGP